MTEQKAHPTTEDLEVVQDADDVMTVVLRGHQLVDELMDIAISDRLAQPHALEVKAMPFSLKSDLAIALGILPDSFRGLFTAINRLRNRFAHDRRAVLGADEARDLYNSLPEPVRLPRIDASSEPLLIARVAFIGVYVNLERAISWHRDKEARMAASMEYLEEVLERSSFRNAGDDPRSGSKKYVAEKLEADRAHRRSKGEF